MYLQHSFFFVLIFFRVLKKKRWEKTGPAQAAFSLLLFACLKSLDYFGFQLNAALLNCRLDEKRQKLALPSCAADKIEKSEVTLTAVAISLMSSPMYSFPVPLNGIFVLTMLTNTPILSWV